MRPDHEWAMQRGLPAPKFGSGRSPAAAPRPGLGRPLPSGRCMITVSSQRPNLQPTFSKPPTRRKPGLLVQADRCEMGGIADDRDHLTHAAAGRRRSPPRRAEAARCPGGAPRARCRPSPRPCSDSLAGRGTARHRHSPRCGRRARRRGRAVPRAGSPASASSARPDPAARARTRPCPRSTSRA